MLLLSSIIVVQMSQIPFKYGSFLAKLQQKCDIYVNN